MILDLIYAVLIVFAIIKGFQRGLILGIFSLVSVIIGLAAAIKLSAVVAGYIGKAVKVSDQWLPVISFAVVFLLVILLIRWGAKIIERTVQMAMLGWVNRLGGIILYSVIYTLVFSVVIFYAEKLQILKPETREKSVTYQYIQPLGPKVIDGFGKVIPIFRDMFTDLEEFFDGVARDIKK